ncbi:MAG: two-component system response regulator BaeR [Rhodospirillales bacterium]
MSKTILIVEDEVALAEVLRDYLQREGYRVLHEVDGARGLEAAEAARPDLLILDLMLPGLDGLEVCRRLRERSAVPIIMTTAKVEEIDRLLGLELGADDYVCKPYSPREVVARVKSVLRRADPTAAPVDAPSDGLRLDRDAYRASVGETLLDLTPTEFRLLSVLSSRPGRVYSRAQILDLAYDETHEAFDRVVDSHVKNLRRKLAAAGLDQSIIRSVYGVGYSFDGEVAAG